MANNVSFDISIAYKDFVNSINKMTDSVNGFVKTSSSGLSSTQDTLNKGIPGAANKSKDAISSLSSSTESGFSSMTGAVFAGQLAFGIFTSAVSFAKEAIVGSLGAYADQEESINKLKQALNGVGDGTQESVDAVMSFSAALQANSKYSDDAIARQVAFVISLGHTKTKAEEVVEAAANMAAVLGGSLEENVDKLSKTLSGNAGRLAQYIPELKNLTDEQLKAGAAADIINKKWSGASRNDINTYQGSIAQLKNSFNDLQEVLGGAIINSDIFKGALNSIKGVIDSVTRNLDLTAIKQRHLNGEQQRGSRTVEQLANDHAMLSEELKKTQQGITDAESHGLLNIFYPTALLKKNKEDLIKQLDELDTILSTSRQQDKTNKADPVIAKVLSKEEIAAQKTMLLNHQNTIKEKLRISEEGDISLLELQHKTNFEQAAIDLENQTLTIEQRQVAYQELLDQRIAQEQADMEAKQLNQQLELQLVYEHERAKAAIIFDSNERKKAQQEATDKFTLESQKLKSKQELDAITLNSQQQKLVLEHDNRVQKDLAARSLNDKRDTMNLFKTLATAKNKELALIGKAAAITQIAIDTPPAVGSAFRFGSSIGGPPVGFLFAGIAGTAMAVQAANVAGLQFEQGGVIPGQFSTGDRIPILANAGEMVLNKSQQANLFAIANNGGSNNSDAIIERLNSLEQALLSRPVVLVANDIEIARSTSRGVMNGIEIGRSR
jgi:hypothetical protein